MDRKSELLSNLTNVQKKVSAAGVRASRAEGEITLIAVTKNFPSSDVELLAEIGISDVGENKDQEAKQKYKETKSKLVWHFIGQLQSNKVKSVVSYAHYVHSVDRLNLAKEISKQCVAINKEIQVFIQVDLGEDNQNRGGVAPKLLPLLAAEIETLPKVKLVGLMAVAPLNTAPANAFEKLIEIRAGFLQDHPQARLLSIGMSDDFETAIEFGATHLRIGSLLLGVRPNLR
ncbi:MAG: YggS family pyridoxal phosphate-dependent enzyme [Candidatus Nanopelagicales bacterium]